MTSVEDPQAVQRPTAFDLRATWHQDLRPPDRPLSFFMTNATNTIHLAGTDDLQDEFGDNAHIYAPPRMFGFGLKCRFGASAAE